MWKYIKLRDYYASVKWIVIEKSIAFRYRRLSQQPNDDTSKHKTMGQLLVCSGFAIRHLSIKESYLLVFEVADMTL